ncbi:unnamed protein product [Rhizoctonia solani]|nr:unnamed protein product [Rhizoctonia solani]
MSVFSWTRRPSGADTRETPRPRTTSGGGGGLAAILSLSKAKSRERLRTNKASSNRQTVVSTESESSVWPEPTTPSSERHQGVGVVGDDPFARPPVYIKESPVPSLAAFPDPPPRNMLRPPNSSRASSPNRSRSTSASSSMNASKSPRTPPPLMTSVSDMHAHADAFSWTESIYDDRPIEDAPSIRPSRLVHSASTSHLSSSASCHSGRAGSSAVSGMGSMTALASGIVQRLEDGEVKKPPKRPSRSELRDPPTRKSSLLAPESTRSPEPKSPPVSPRLRTASSPSRLRPTASPRLPSSPPASPTLFSPTFPARLSEDSEDLDNYHFTIAPRIQESDAQSISFSELGIQLADDDVWSDDGVTFHHGPTDSPRYGPSRRPPPSPTSLPFMAGNARRRMNHDMVYPSGVHTIPMADKRALAKLGKDQVGKEEDAVVGVELGPSTRIPIEEEHDHASTSSESSLAPDAVPPQTISSHVAFSKHARTASYSDSELDLDMSSRVKARSNQTQTAVAWRCGAGNHEKCCQTRAMQSTHPGQYKCCAERTVAGKHARCCASYIGRPCEHRPRVSSTSSAELKRQRSLHFASAKGFFHRPHTSHGKSTSSALLDDETRAMIQAQSQAREDPGPQSPALDSSPPTSPAPSRHEFKAKPIISPAKLHDHLKQDLLSSFEPTHHLALSSLEPTRTRRNTDTESLSSSARSVFSNLSEDAPAPMRSLLPPRPRRNHQVSLPVVKTSQVEQPRRYVQSITGVVQSAGLTRPGPVPFGSSPGPSRLGLPPPPPPPRRDQVGRTNSKPIVSFISSRSAPTPTMTEPPPNTLRHCSSRESYESTRTVRRERSIPLRETQMSFLEFGVDEEEEEGEEESSEEEEDMAARSGYRPALHHSSSFLDLDLTRLSGDTMRETDAMFSRS